MSNFFDNNWQQDVISPVDHDSSNLWSYEGGYSMNDSDLDASDKKRMNISYCSALHRSTTDLYAEKYGDEFCKVNTDTINCWPPTLPNQTVLVKCFDILDGIVYDATQNVTKACLPNATWNKANYDACKEIPSEDFENSEVHLTIYFVGYTASLVSLLLAIGIFIHFKELRCLRNIIHMNFMCSHVLFCLIYICVSLLVVFGGMSNSNCIYFATFINFTHLTTFFWMFVEGLYLYILVVETLTRENFKLRIYVSIGWGMPVLITIIWIVTASLIAPADYCPLYQDDHPVKWILQTPILCVLAINMMFLIAIMWVLITKLRSANSVEAQQYHKASKALLVLMPLLGITYVIILWAPIQRHQKFYFDIFRAVTLSSQGFTVALLYCFLNTEVKNAIRHHFENWKANRSLGPSRNRSGSRSKDWSPRSRTESIRLYSQPTNIYHKRESTASEVTTTTLITVNGGASRSSNGSNAARSPFLQPPRLSYAGNV